ncbi:hypothetical protein PMZ80_002666 [Knufia obscura]|uniref:ER membrane protein complex subunit 1 n=1 Tax=Knufia obscura TaxID=1635080 RepID=A0ABR0RXZ4_9EURO|nr:hypothetical protein PMZ80_002666 [Knufia obscura]
MRWYGILLSALAIAPAHSIYVDEAFNIDFHQALLGTPHTTFFHKPDSSSNAALLYSLSDKAVLGALNPRDGSLVWRQAIAGQPRENATDAYLIAGEDDGKITTAFEKTVTTWDASDGRLVWTHGIKGRSRAIGLQAVPVLGSSTDGAVQDVILLTQPQKEGGGYVVSRLGGDGSGERWRHSDFGAKLDAVVSIATSPKHVYHVTKSSGIISGQKTQVVVLDMTTGKQIKEYTVSLDAESVSFDGELVAGSSSAAPFMITSDKPYKTLKLNVLGNTKVATVTLEDKTEDVLSVKVHYARGPKALPHFLAHVQTATRHWAEVYHINTASGEATRAYSLPATQEASAFSASTNGEKVFFTRVTSTEVIVYSSESHGHLGRWTRTQLGVGYASSSEPVSATAEVASRDVANIAVRVAVAAPEGSWYMIRNGDTQWSRTEMLAYADMAAWSDDLAADSLVQELQEEISVDPATAYVNRVYRHATELRHLPAYLMQLPQKMFGSSNDEVTARQNLIGTKSLILKTKQNKLFSVSGVTGKLQWHTDLSPVLPAESTVRSLATQEGRITMYNSEGSVIVVNATTGQLIENKSGSTPVNRLVELPGSPASTILKVDEDGTPQFASDLAPSVPDEGNTVMTIDKSGAVSGWTVGTTISKTWTFSPPNAKIVDITARPAHDPIASIGRVLGDRSVLYKYFTPNLALLTAVSSTTLTIYLIDAVTGTILHTSSHPGLLPTSPISTIISENWFAYTFTSTNPTTHAITPQLIISELYESSLPNDRGALSSQTNYSSFGPDATTKPHVISAAFVLTEPIANLTVTQTAQGITNRQLLAYLPHSHAIASIPRHILDARRPIDRDPTTAEIEEGLFRYDPSLPLNPQQFLSHSREVMGINSIMTAPTLLESTSMVFAFGHDVFGTQVAPSQTFDVLGRGFKKVQLVGTVVALYFGVLGVRPLVRRKVVERGWM